VRIKKIFVRNYGPLKNAVWKIDPSLGVVVLCGPHGAGKSTFIDAIDLCFTRMFTYTMPTPIRFPFANGMSAGITVLPTCDSDREVLGARTTFEIPTYDSLEQKRQKTFGMRVPFGCVHPSSFVPFKTGETWYRLHHPFDGHVDLLWANPNRDYLPRDPILLFATTLGVLRREEDVNSIIALVNSYLSKAVNLELVLKDDTLYCKRSKESEIVEINHLSEAEYSAIGLLLFGLVWLPPSGILLIDSPEMYLHPMAQNIVLSAIVSRLTKGQVIIATHSPSLIANRPANELYVLKIAKDHQTPIRAGNADAILIVRQLYGKDTSRSVLRALSDYSSTSTLAYLIQCSTKPEAVTRHKGDPQIQQLATWMLGYMQSLPLGRITIADIGAGKGDLLDAIQASGYADRLRYIPVEPKEKYWRSINRRAKKIPNLESLAPRKSIFDLDHVDIIFFVNVLHEVSLPTRIELISHSLRLTYPKGMIVVHEVSVLPSGEADFVIWSGEDIREIFKNANIDVDIVIAQTFTRPKGWPLQTICIKALCPPPPPELLMKGAIHSLPNMLERWTKELGENRLVGIGEELKDSLKAFRMAQVANLCVWLQTYLKSNIGESVRDVWSAQK
jgi:hypothetical protein